MEFSKTNSMKKNKHLPHKHHTIRTKISDKKKEGYQIQNKIIYSFNITFLVIYYYNNKKI